MLFLPLITSGRERDTRHERKAPLPENRQSFTRRRDQQRGTNDFSLTSAPTFAPTKEQTYLPALSTSSVNAGNRAPMQGYSTNSGGSVLAVWTRPLLPKKSPCPTAASSAPTGTSSKVPITASPSQGTVAPVERPSPAPLKLTSPPTAHPQQQPSPTVHQTEAPSGIPSTTLPLTEAPSGLPSATIPQTEAPSGLPSSTTSQIKVPSGSVAPIPPPTSSHTNAPSQTRAPEVSSPPTPISQGNPILSCNVTEMLTFWKHLGAPFAADGVFANPAFYQCQAFGRITKQKDYTTFDLAKAVKYWVLNCIYFATNVPSNGTVQQTKQGSTSTTWINTQGWEASNLGPCDGWYGISCDANGRITEIRLQRNGLSGTFPPEVRYLASDGPYATGAGKLQRLEIFKNEYLTNRVADPWISELGSNLTVLNYGSTSFRGTIPKLPPGISEFDCSYTLYSGVIPEDVFRGLDKLRFLVLDGNNFDSVVPSSISALPNLELFYIREAGVRGDLSYMEGMPSIIEHLVDGNKQLSGPMYSFMGELATLKSFSATNCGLVSRAKEQEHVAKF